jgi:hypothetical protein
MVEGPFLSLGSSRLEYSYSIYGFCDLRYHIKILSFKITFSVIVMKTVVVSTPGNVINLEAFAHLGVQNVCKCLLLLGVSDLSLF